MLGEEQGGDLPSEVPPKLPVFPLRAHRCAGSNVNSLILIDPGIWADLSGVLAGRRLNKKRLHFARNDSPLVIRRLSRAPTDDLV